MIKVKDGYAKLIGTTYAGTADRVLLSNGSDFGLHTGRNNEANKIVRTDASGYIQAGWISTTSGDMGTAAINRIYCSNDNWIRYKTPANFFSTLANDSNQLSITVGSQNRKLTVAYATNAASATKLQTARNIWGQLFDGSNNVAGNMYDVGQITFLPLSGTDGRALLYQPMADNDFFRIYVGGTASNSGYAEIATADDGNEPIYVRQYSDVFNTIKRTLTLLDGSGNSSFPGSLTLNGELINTGSGIWVQGGSSSGGNVGRMSLVNGMPNGLAYNTSRGVRIYSNAIAFADPYNGNSNNDAGWIRHIEETADRGQLEIAVGDNNINETIVVRRYNTSSEVGKELYLFNSAGDSTFPGNVGIGTNPDGGNEGYKLYVNGNIYSNNITNSNNFISRVTTGTQPYACTSTTVNTNLNADLLDGYHESSFTKKHAEYRFASVNTAPNKYVWLCRIGNGSAYSGMAITLDVDSRYHKHYQINMLIATGQYAYSSSSISINKSDNAPNVYYFRTLNTSDVGYDYFDIYVDCGSWNFGGYKISNLNSNGSLIFTNKCILVDSLPIGTTSVASYVSVNSGTSSMALAYYSDWNTISQYSDTVGSSADPVFIQSGKPLTCTGIKVNSSYKTITGATIYWDIRRYGRVVVVSGKISSSGTTNTTQVLLDSDLPYCYSTYGAGVTISKGGGDAERHIVLYVSGSSFYCDPYNFNGINVSYFSFCYMS